MTALAGMIDDVRVAFEEFKETSMDPDKLARSDVKSLAELFSSLNAIKDIAKEFTTTLNKSIDNLRLSVIPDRMDEDSIEKISIAGIGTMYLTDDLLASIIKGKKEDAYEFFREAGLGSLISETLNASTLKAQIKAMIKKGEVVPDDIFKVNPFTRAAIKRS